MEILKIEGLSKSFGSKKVLSSLSLSVPEHSIFGFVGKNGSGKTTTMKAILGLIKADEGEIYVMGEPVKFGETPTNRFIGYLPDVPEFYKFMTAREYLTLCGESLELDHEECKKRTDELLELVGLKNERSRIKGFSRGMKQRLGIAQALIGRPKLLICDEPTSALDPIGRKEILDIISSVKEQTTVIFSTHILSDVERICTDVALINNGRIELSGSVEEILGAGDRSDIAIELASGAEVFLSAFPEARTDENGVITLEGDEEKMLKILDFIKENRLPIKKIERISRSLESLFMEVVTK